ncbi:hypothetical protein UlMin_023675 [Ulmus minor]
MSPDGVLDFKGRLCIPDNDELKEQILSEAHTTPYSVHPGTTKMYKDQREQLWWQGMKKEYGISPQCVPHFYVEEICTGQISCWSFYGFKLGVHLGFEHSFLTQNPEDPCYAGVAPLGTLRWQHNEKMETIGSETEAYAIADMISYVKSEVYIVNYGMAFGQAALLLSLRAKGHRVVQPNSSTKLYLPKVDRSSGAVIEMWIEAKELDANTESYIDLLAKGIGKPKEEIAKEIQRPKYFQAQEAIEYGIVDIILNSQESAFDKRSYNQNYNDMLAQSRAMKRSAGGPPQASPFGFR